MPILTLDQLIAAKPLDFWPTPIMPGYQKPRETSEYWERNPGRNGTGGHSKHKGSDIMYPALPDDPKSRCDSGYTTPVDTPIIACGHGYVQKTRAWVKPNNGGYVYLNIFASSKHDDSTGWRNRYHHLSEVSVKVGEWVKPGDVLGWIREKAPSSVPHLHFELLKYNSYEYEDPMPLLEDVQFWAWAIEDKPSLTRDRALIAWDRAMEVARLEFVRRLG